MAQKIAQQQRFCKNCGVETTHQRNTKEMSWFVHLVLAVFTAGLWLIVWLLVAIYHVLTKPIGGKWTCAACGGKPSGSARSVLSPTPQTHVKCPDCRELVLRDARKCKHCSCALIPQ